MWLNQLRQMHIIDASAYAMGRFINQYNQSDSVWPGLLCALSIQAIKQGHTCLDCTRLAEQFPALLNYPDLLDNIELSTLNRNTLIGQGELQSNTLFTVNQSYLFSNKFFDLESRLLQAMATRINSLVCPDAANSAEQLAQLCFYKPISFLSGGPGTGKTTCLSRALPSWVELFQQNFNRLPKISMCAPTGKAAARMSAAWLEQKTHLLAKAQSSIVLDCIPDQAITLHRLLAINPLNKHAKFTALNPLALDFLVVDEASMIDLPLFVQLLEALPKHAHVLLIGDAQQLPAIEAGNILGSLLDATSTHSFFTQLQYAHLHLEINYRQKQHLGLTRLAHDCLFAEPEQIVETLSEHGYDCVKWLENTPQAFAHTIATAIKHYTTLESYAQPEAALQAAKSFTILCAVREGLFGCININNEIMRRLNPGAKDFFHGQLILITENAKHLGLSNGDILIIWQHANQQLMAYYQSAGQMQALAIAALPAFEPAYALTIHKSQGSEYSHVCVVLPELDSPVLTKSLLYTAFTRAKNDLQIIATKQSLLCSLAKPMYRVNGLALLAEQLMEKKIQ